MPHHLPYRTKPYKISNPRIAGSSIKFMFSTREQINRKLLQVVIHEYGIGEVLMNTYGVKFDITDSARKNVIIDTLSRKLKIWGVSIDKHSFSEVCFQLLRFINY